MLDFAGRILKKLNHPERRSLAAEFKQELNKQAHVIHIPAALVASVAWLGFALDTDRRLHPEFPELIYFRLGLSVLGVLLLACAAIDALAGQGTLRGKGLGWMYVVVGYTVWSVSFFTGILPSDPNYVSGMQIAIMLVIFLPFPRRITYSIYTASILLFLAAAIWKQTDMSKYETQYSMQNLAIAYVVAIVMGFILDSYRFSIFRNHREVVQKSRQIQENMQELKKLKEKQDGDYFLTANLIKPLIKNSVGAGPVSIEFYLDQHKKFNFRHWNSEIGGDYLHADRINLRDESFICFINGDAMGKSIQGAGGALVLGTVFRTIVMRSQEQESGLYPENWLKNAFAELQNVFITFDGTMLISAVIGLLSEKTGMLYYMNAEHPRPVLYRDRSARFLEEQNLFRKLGILSNSTSLSVECLRLQRDDVLFIASDGRDDLVLQSDESGARQINEDEQLFLECVSASQGNLSDLVQSVKGKGLLMDDLSIMRIGYLEDAPVAQVDEEKEQFLANALRAHLDQSADARLLLEKALASCPTNIAAHEALLELYNKEGLLEQSLKVVLALAELDPARDQWLYAIMTTAKKIFKTKRHPALLELAVANGERLRLRQRQDIKTLVHLADACRLLGRRDRFLKILEEAEGLGGSDPRVQKLRALAS